MSLKHSDYLKKRALCIIYFRVSLEECDNGNERQEFNIFRIRDISQAATTFVTYAILSSHSSETSVICANWNAPRQSSLSRSQSGNASAGQSLLRQTRPTCICHRIPMCTHFLRPNNAQIRAFACTPATLLRSLVVSRLGSDTSSLFLREKCRL